MNTVLALVLIVSAYIYCSHPPKPSTSPSLRSKKEIGPQPWIKSHGFDPAFEYPDNQLDFSIYDPEFHKEKKMLLVGKPSKHDWLILFPPNESVCIYRDNDDNYWVEEKNAMPYLLTKSSEHYSCIEEKTDDEESSK